jgi:curved DNA-binding protein CbpA
MDKVYEENAYEVLGVPVNAAYADIKKAYFALVRKYPPDRFPKKFMSIREAYEILSNEATRREYDSIALISSMAKEEFRLGKMALERGDIEEAIAYLENALLKAPHSRVISGFLGRAYLENGNSGKAIGIFKKLTEEESDNPSFLRYLASAYMERGWHKKAVPIFKKALTLDEDNISLWLGLTDAYAMGKNFEEAREVLIGALERGKDTEWDNLGIYLRLIELEIILEDHASMKIHLDELTRLAVNDEINRENIGWAMDRLSRHLVHIGLTEEAQMMVERAIRLIPDNPEIEKLRDELARFNRSKEQFEVLLKDKTIKEEIVRLIEVELVPSEVIFNTKEPFKLILEFTIIEEVHSFISSINRLKEKYPDLYELKEAFFDGVLNPARRKKMMYHYSKKMKRHHHVIEALMRSSTMEEDEYNYEVDFDEAEEDVWESQQPYVKKQPKIGRNEPCPCGSGKKYKKCCGR